MSTNSNEPVRRFKDASKKISFKIDSNTNGKFDIYQCPDGQQIWKLVKSNQTLTQVMKFQESVVNDNILNYYNFLSIIKNDKSKTNKRK